jgi:hypothetical protein
MHTYTHTQIHTYIHTHVIATIYTDSQVTLDNYKTVTHIHI